jgi:hypothetical protein
MTPRPSCGLCAARIAEATHSAALTFKQYKESKGLICTYIPVHVYNPTGDRAPLGPIGEQEPVPKGVQRRRSCYNPGQRVQI